MFLQYPRARLPRVKSAYVWAEGGHGIVIPLGGEPVEVPDAVAVHIIERDGDIIFKVEPPVAAETAQVASEQGQAPTPAAPAPDASTGKPDASAPAPKGQAKGPAKKKPAYAEKDLSLEE
jgi:hypothetical protein